ncbi:hypothetical protein [Streptomyces sp. NPDC018045]|uniref:hypothetical protein n=1 Tax=Streptomyces sp. NPDC018045 TaxID=3365037 RepID=UPI003792DFAF
MLWRHCAHLGRVLLPLVDQEAWRQARRHETLKTWGIDIVVGERLIEIFTALAAHAVVADTSVSAAGFDALPLSAVADAATGKRDIELLAGLPSAFADDSDRQAVNVFRLYTYKGGQYSRQLFHLSREVRHSCLVLVGRLPMPVPTCGDLFRRAAEVGLPQ